MPSAPKIWYLSDIDNVFRVVLVVMTFDGEAIHTGDGIGVRHPIQVKPLQLRLRWPTTRASS